MTQKTSLNQLARMIIFMFIFGFFMSNGDTARAEVSGITPTPIPDPTDTPVPTEVPNTPVPVQPTATATSQPAPTSTPVSSGSSNPAPTPTPNFPTEIPELGYGPSIWVSLSVLLILTLLLGGIAAVVVRRISS